MYRFVRYLVQQNSVLTGQRLLALNRGSPSVLCTTTQLRGLLTTKKEVSRDVIAFLQQEIDLRPVAIKRWKKRKEWELLVKDHE